MYILKNCAIVISLILKSAQLGFTFRATCLCLSQNLILPPDEMENVVCCQYCRVSFLLNIIFANILAYPFITYKSFLPTKR